MICFAKDIEVEIWVSEDFQTLCIRAEEVCSCLPVRDGIEVVGKYIPNDMLAPLMAQSVLHINLPSKVWWSL